MKYSALLCILSYLCIAFLPIPALGLAGCAICGLSVGIMWPEPSAKLPASMRETAELPCCPPGSGRDLGCSGGPTLAGMVSSALGDNLRMGILAAIIFPILMILGIQALKKA